MSPSESGIYMGKCCNGDSGVEGPNQNGVSMFNSDMVVLGRCRLRARLVRVICFDKVVL